MTDIAITAANVLAGSDSTRENGKAGVAITAGQVVYKASDGTYKLADTNDSVAAARKPAGIALNGASAGQPLTVLTKGSITIGGTLVGGTAYYLSSTAGGIAPVADLTTGDRPALLGMATSATVLYVDILAPDVEL